MLDAEHKLVPHFHLDRMIQHHCGLFPVGGLTRSVQLGLIIKVHVIPKGDGGELSRFTNGNLQQETTTSCQAKGRLCCRAQGFINLFNHPTQRRINRPKEEFLLPDYKLPSLPGWMCLNTASSGLGAGAPRARSEARRARPTDPGTRGREPGRVSVYALKVPKHMALFPFLS